MKCQVLGVAIGLLSVVSVNAQPIAPQYDLKDVTFGSYPLQEQGVKLDAKDMPDLSKRTLIGTLTIHSGSMITHYGGRCKGRRAYNAFYPGASVTIYDANKNIVAMGTLSEGKGSIGFDTNCKFSYFIDNIPESNFYQIQIGDRTTNVSKEFLDQRNWKLDYHLGTGR